MATTLEQMMDDQRDAEAARQKLGGGSVHRRVFTWNSRNGAKNSVTTGWYATPEEADERAINVARALGWEPAKWWQWWRWGEQR